MFCRSQPHRLSELRSVVRSGSYYRTSDSKWVQRFRCRGCRRSFSHATNHPDFAQKKRQHNTLIKRLICSGASHREIAKIASVNRKTVVRKLLFLAAEAEKELREMNRHLPKATDVQFDDLITSEHTKCKPLAVSMAVESKTRRILDFEVARMPASGAFAKTARKKYGPRADERKRVRHELFTRMQAAVDPCAVIKSDLAAHYTHDIARFFPNAEHQRFKGRRSRTGTFGELKIGGFDPIFSINHTFAMLRYRINRLMRKTWCTTKRADRLRAHLMIYAVYHNTDLIKRELQPK